MIIGWLVLSVGLEWSWRAAYCTWYLLRGQYASFIWPGGQAETGKYLVGKFHVSVDASSEEFVSMKYSDAAFCLYAVTVF